jgi:hypothetical protein
MTTRSTLLRFVLALAFIGCRHEDGDRSDAAGGEPDSGGVADGGSVDVSEDGMTGDETGADDGARHDNGAGDDGIDRTDAIVPIDVVTDVIPADAVPSDDAIATDAVPTDVVGPMDASRPAPTRCLDVQGPRGCCGLTTNYYFENDRVVTRECVAPQECGYLEIAPGQFGYRCGGRGAPAEDFIMCGYTLKSEAACAALGHGAATSPDATFPCGTTGLKCEIGRQYCGLYSKTVHRDADMCVPLPAHCATPNATCAECEAINPRPWLLARCDDVKPGAIVVTPFP